MDICAESKNYRDIVQFLLEHGADSRDSASFDLASNTGKA